ncbi:hypothetical protein Chor_010633 [Crotalus horridus]
MSRAFLIYANVNERRRQEVSRKGSVSLESALQDRLSCSLPKSNPCKTIQEDLKAAGTKNGWTFKRNPQRDASSARSAIENISQDRKAYLSSRDSWEAGLKRIQWKSPVLQILELGEVQAVNILASAPSNRNLDKFQGAAKMILETGEHPAVLRSAVCTPGGTTIHALHELEKGSLRATVMNAVEAATSRARELGNR